MSEELEWEALIRYLGDRSDAEERARVERWLASGDCSRALDEAMRSLAREPVELVQSFDAELASGRLLSRMRRPRPHVVVPPSGPKRSGVMLTTAIAASILIAVMGVVMWRESTVDAGGQDWIVTETGRGETRQLSFPSGTRVVLSAMSRLHLPRGVASPSEMELEGEAFVELGPEQKRPFILRTRGAEIVDKGTAFVAREYAGDSVAHVAVVQGRVEVRSGRRESKRRGRTVVAGEIARAPAGLDTVLVERGNVQRELAWMQGDLAFDGASMDDVAATLERWLDVEIKIADSSLARRRFTGRLRAKSVREVADILSAVLDARVQSSGRVLTITTK